MYSSILYRGFFCVFLLGSLFLFAFCVVGWALLMKDEEELLMMWCIWKERNNRCFEDSERAIPDIKLLFFRTLLEWFSVWRNHSFSLLDLLDFCNFRFWFVLPCILPVCLGVSFLSMKSYYLSKKKSCLWWFGHI